MIISRSILIAGLLLAVLQAYNQPVPGNAAQNEPYIADTCCDGQNQLIIYVIPPRVRYDWSTPATLYKSYIRNFKRNLLRFNSYSLGHAFVDLHSSQPPGRIFTGMRAKNKKEKKKLVLKEHYGLAILGADLEGALEPADDLEKKVEKYSRKGQMSFMSVCINNEAAERMNRFYSTYKQQIDSAGSRGARYGGAFWPRYHGEGAGCSAFAVSFLDLAGILVEDFDNWLVSINIPMSLIGGPYNHYNQVRIRDIKNASSWGGEEITGNIDYEHFEIFDPGLMYDWIQEQIGSDNSEPNYNIRPAVLNKSKGILIDAKNIPVPADDSIFKERTNSSIFIDHYQK